MANKIRTCRAPNVVTTPAVNRQLADYELIGWSSVSYKYLHFFHLEVVEIHGGPIRPPVSIPVAPLGGPPPIKLLLSGAAAKDVTCLGRVHGRGVMNDNSAAAGVGGFSCAEVAHCRIAHDFCGSLRFNQSPGQ